MHSAKQKAKNKNTASWKLWHTVHCRERKVQEQLSIHFLGANAHENINQVSRRKPGFGWQPRSGQVIQRAKRVQQKRRQIDRVRQQGNKTKNKKKIACPPSHTCTRG
jgi:hypothetical protein